MNTCTFCILEDAKKVIMQEIIEFVNSNSVIPEKEYKHRLENKGTRLFLRLKFACHNAYEGDSICNEIVPID